MNSRKSDQHQRANRWVKYMGTGFVVWAGIVMAAGMSWSLGSTFLATGLFQLLIAPEKIDDERVKQLKLQAIFWGYGIGYALVALHNFASQRPLSLIPPTVLTAFDGFIIATTFALGLFHYWRWQDGRAENPT